MSNSPAQSDSSAVALPASYDADAAYANAVEYLSRVNAVRPCDASLLGAAYVRRYLEARGDIPPPLSHKRLPNALSSPLSAGASTATSSGNGTVVGSLTAPIAFTVTGDLGATEIQTKLATGLRLLYGHSVGVVTNNPASGAST